MRKITTGFFISLLVFLFLSGCNSNSNGVVNEDLFQYKDSYVGDNSAVGNIAKQLPSPTGEQISELELKTTEPPYGIVLNYVPAETTDQIAADYKELALYNATFIFALVKNADWVDFKFVEKEYRVTRESLESWYGKDLSEFKSEDELSKFTQKYFEDENKVNDFFK